MNLYYVCSPEKLSGLLKIYSGLCFLELISKRNLFVLFCSNADENLVAALCTQIAGQKRRFSFYFSTFYISNF